MGSQQEMPLIILGCPADIEQADALCLAMERSLTNAAPNHIVRRMAKGPDAPESDLVIDLKITQLRGDAVRGYLEWTKKGKDGRETGPELQYDVMDAQLTPELLREFTDGLVQASPLF